ncbi:MAG: glycoside hydrolase family 38 C-terminal domain-containing protein, partial [Armatimonadota bacterium]
AFYATPPRSAADAEGGPDAAPTQADERDHQAHASLVVSPDCLSNSEWSIRFRHGAIASVLWHDEPISADNDMPFGALFALGDDAVDIEECFTGERWEMAYDDEGIEVLEAGPVRATVRLRGSLLGCPVVQRISLYEGLPRLDLTTTIDWRGEHNRQVRMNLPILMPEGRITYETPYGHCTFNEDEIEGSYRGTGGRFVQKWIDVSCLAMGVTIATRHCAHAFEDTAVFPILLNTSYSCGDRFLWYENEGRHTFDVSLVGHAYGWREACSFRHGWEFNSPLIVADTCFWHPRKGGAWSPTKVGEKGDLPHMASLLEVDSPNVIVTAVKAPRTGKGIIVRLFEVVGEALQVHLKVPSDVASAEEVNLLEEHIADIPASGNVVTLAVSSYGIHTIRIVPAQARSSG